ncbi:MAG: glycosyltransferase family 1 protein [Chloroflexota bacterium]
MLLDAHQLGRRQTGNETYVRELLRGLREVDQLAITAAIETGVERTGVLAPPVATRRVPANGFARLASLTLLARQLRPDVVHAIYFLPVLTGRPTVLTIHDISYERHPEFFSWKELLRNRAMIRGSARRATRIITVSEASRNDLIELYGVEPSRVSVVYNGVGPQFRPGPAGPVRPAFDGSRPLRVLAVGTLQERKNLVRLLDAVRLIAPEIAVTLRIVGPDGYQAAAIRARLAGAADTEILGWVDDEHLADEYRRADVLVYPSIYEGFGLPVVEAMACGTPVITSTGGSLPEVAGDAALIVDPLDVEAIAHAIRRVATEPVLAAELAARGLVRASDFSWDRAATEHARIYAEVAA